MNFDYFEYLIESVINRLIVGAGRARDISQHQPLDRGHGPLLPGFILTSIQQHYPS